MTISAVRSAGFAQAVQKVSSNEKPEASESVSAPAPTKEAKKVLESTASSSKPSVSSNISSAAIAKQLQTVDESKKQDESTKAKEAPAKQKEAEVEYQASVTQKKTKADAAKLDEQLKETGKKEEEAGPQAKL